MGKIWSGNIEELTQGNSAFRKVLRVGKHSELTLMSIEPGSEIGLEVHDDTDQFIRVEAGKARVEAGPSKDNLNETAAIEADWAIVIPAGTWHNIINTGDEPLKLYTVYSPPEHKAGTVHQTRAEADAAHH